jgi:hypothetical protein
MDRRDLGRPPPGARMIDHAEAGMPGSLTDSDLVHPCRLISRPVVVDAPM